MKSKSVPKYMQLKKELQQLIQSSTIKPDEQLPTEFAIAEQFQCSRQTVRQAIGLLENEGLVYRIQGKGTFVARQKYNSAIDHRTVGMMTTYITDYIFPHIVRGAEAELRERSYQLLLASTDNNKQKEQESLSLFLQKQLSGLIIEPTKSAQTNLNLSAYLTLNQLDIPVVMINAHYPELPFPYVAVNDQLGSTMATDHLIELGHSKIVGIFKHDDLQGIERLKGFIGAHQSRHSPLLPQYVITYETDEIQHAIEMVQSLLRSETAPTAIVCYNDDLAVQLIEAARQLHITVPDQLSIVSFDDSSLATALQLTTITHPKEELGKKAAQLLLELIDKKSQAAVQSYVFTPTLIIRGSTKPLQHT
ncbi:GntR family transcriptional regulator [Paenibacillus yanchengensis]|uniref:GntR family transcriptional regulator n=1 Tax=Paenibacillus yanchengensis TaxID=2035833 RepID=A0ABW4YQC1_9BACL